MVSNSGFICPMCKDGLVRERQGPGHQGGGSHSSLLTSNWLCEGRDGGFTPGKAGTEMP